jgi:hypothetical protein
MENGRTKQIARIRTGDKVEAGDPDTGRHKGPREVTATWINDDRDLVDVTIQDSDGRPATLHTTSRHPFWDDTLHAWTAAAQLRAGDALNTDKNFHATVLSVRATPGAANRYNLTVDDLHTYYVRACETPILVHNTGPDVTCSIGDHGYESIPARSKGGNWTKQEIDQNDANGYSFGCHTCYDSRNAKRKLGVGSSTAQSVGTQQISAETVSSMCLL